MARTVRRLVPLLLLAAVGAAVWQRRIATSKAQSPAATWPPFQPAAAPLWVLPIDGACPAGYPVKANDNSKIFHVPGGRFYDRTVPERCYAAAHDAAADGYRQAKA